MKICLDIFVELQECFTIAFQAVFSRLFGEIEGCRRVFQMVGTGVFGWPGPFQVRKAAALSKANGEIPLEGLTEFERLKREAISCTNSPFRFQRALPRNPKRGNRETLIKGHIAEPERHFLASANATKV